MKKNINQILDNLSKTKIYFLTWLILLSFLLRLISVYFVRDINIEHEWHILLDNLIKYRSYSFYTFNDQLIPSVLLPPIYLFFLYFVKIVTSFEGSNFLYSIIFIQIILSTYSVYLFYQLNQNFFSNKLSLVNSIIFSVIPLNIYTCGQISSITLQIFFSLLFLNFLLAITEKQTKLNMLIFSMVSGLLILTRGEFILIFILIIFFIYKNKKIKLINVIKIFIIVFLIISPYLARNYIHFNQIFLVKSLGFNLWKGNNELSRVEGYEEKFDRIEFQNLKLNLTNLEKNKYYEINRDNIFLNEAINNLNRNPLRYFKLFFEKFFSFYFIDLNSSYPNYYSFFHIFPIIILSVFSFPGLFIFYKINKFKNRCLGFYLFSNLIIFSVFFILPRYKLIILPIQLILSAYFIIFILKKLNGKNFKRKI